MKSLPEVRIARANDVPAAFGALRRARKKSLVRIRESRVGEVIRTSWGDLVASPGDLIIVHESGEEAAIKRDIFDRSYEPVSNGYYRKYALSRLVQVPPGVIARVASLEGELLVSHPDFIVIGVFDEVYANAAQWVEENLEFLPEFEAEK